MHQNALGGRAPPGHAGGAYSAPQNLAGFKGAGAGTPGRELDRGRGGKGKGGKRGGRKRKRGGERAVP